MFRSQGRNLRCCDVGVVRTSPLLLLVTAFLFSPQENRNKQLVATGEQEWTFGQIMALVQIISTFNEMLHFLISLFSSNKDEEDGGFGDATQFEDSDSANVNCAFQYLFSHISSHC